MRSVLVRVFDAGGRPVSGARVVVWVYQFLAGGAVPEQYTNSSGEAEFNLNVDASAEISIRVNGTDKILRGAIQGSYRVQV